MTAQTSELVGALRNIAAATPCGRDQAWIEEAADLIERLSSSEEPVMSDSKSVEKEAVKGALAKAYLAGAYPVEQSMTDVKIELVEALRPFANFADLDGADLLPDNHVITLGSGMAARQLTMGDCRRALDALAALSAQESIHD